VYRLILHGHEKVTLAGASRHSGSRNSPAILDPKTLPPTVPDSKIFLPVKGLKLGKSTVRRLIPCATCEGCGPVASGLQIRVWLSLMVLLQGVAYTQPRCSSVCSVPALVLSCNSSRSTSSRCYLLVRK
jgi:hypothetical protein